MQTGKWTPGPWGYSRTHEKSLNYWYVITHHGGYGPIVDVGGKDLNGQIAEAKHLITDPKEIEANAHLIAAAPEMLDYLIFHKQGGYDGERLINIIEKATGLKIEDVIK
jgi:hypothetical protein